MSGYPVWFTPVFAALLTAVPLGWALVERFAPRGRLAASAGRLAVVPGALWALAGAAAFLLPVFVYWISARSHGNALAGYLPWNDAAGYYGCSQNVLLGLHSGDVCARRPFYFAFFAGLLWLTDNRLQLALLVQALLVGGGTVLLVCALARDLNGAALAAVYAVLFAFAGALCTSLVMTENIGLLLGLLSLAILWRQAESPSPALFFLALVLMAAAQNSRSGAMLVLPALLGWVMVHPLGALRRRAGLALAGFAGILAGLFIASAPALIMYGKLGGAQANFSYSLYGLVAGGKGWLHVFNARPDIFAAGGNEAAIAQRIYRASLELALSQPHLFLLGYLKGLAHYLSEIFEFTDAFKPFRFLVLVPCSLAGVWVAIRKRRQPKFSLLLWLGAGIFLSSPFITFDAGTRVFAATMGVDAVFVGLGVAWLSGYITTKEATQPKRRAQPAQALLLPAATVCALLMPLLVAVVSRTQAPPPAYAAPSCDDGLLGVVVQSGEGTLVMPIVAPGRESLFPLRVRADHFAARMDKAVDSKAELLQEPGRTLVWGYRLDDAGAGTTLRFLWEGKGLPARKAVGFCVRLPGDSGRNIATAVGPPVALK